MASSTLIDAPTLRTHLDDSEWIIIDCRFSLTEPERGQQEYLQAHIPGALYAHLDRDLSGPIVPGQTGRHPLPEPGVLAGTFSAWGIEPGSQVVAYDDTGGSFAARLWWCLRWLGHRATAVLDGGWRAWERAGYPISSGPEQRAAAVFLPRPDPGMLADAATVQQRSADPGWRLVDSRAPERFQGEQEPLDPVAGRIPGAVNLPHTSVVGQDGRFLSVEELAVMFRQILDGRPPSQTVVYCGSGVSAARNLLAMEHAGLPGARLYAGSWSHWITDSARPVATGRAE